MVFFCPGNVPHLRFSIVLESLNLDLHVLHDPRVCVYVPVNYQFTPPLVYGTEYQSASGDGLCGGVSRRHVYATCELRLH